MRIHGKREDGTLFVSIGGGLGVLLRGTAASKATDLATLQKMGPWESQSNDSLNVRQVAKQLERAKTVSLSNFQIDARGSAGKKKVVSLDMGMSFDERRDRVWQALCTRLGVPMVGSYGLGSATPYIPQNGIGEDWVVYCTAGKYYGVDYALDTTNGTVTIGSVPQEVSPTWETLGEMAAEAATELSSSPFYMNFMKAKGKSAVAAEKPTMDATIELPGSLPDMNKPAPDTSML